MKQLNFSYIRQRLFLRYPDSLKSFCDNYFRLKSISVSNCNIIYPTTYMFVLGWLLFLTQYT